MYVLVLRQGHWQDLIMAWVMFPETMRWLDPRLIMSGNYVEPVSMALVKFFLDWHWLNNIESSCKNFSTASLHSIILKIYYISSVQTNISWRAIVDGPGVNLFYLTSCDVPYMAFTSFHLPCGADHYSWGRYLTINCCFWCCIVDLPTMYIKKEIINPTLCSLNVMMVTVYALAVHLCMCYFW